MKRIITFVFYFLPLLAVAQDSTIVYSNFEKFSSESGKMYKFETVDVGKAGAIKVSTTIVTDMETGQSAKSLQFTSERGALFTTAFFGSLYVDFDEIDGIIKALRFYKDEIKKGKAKNNPSFEYTTKGDVSAVCSYSSFGWSLSLSKKYHYSRALVPGSLVTIKNKEIEDLAELVEKAKSN